jgi:tetratricopeptide (TPR) repeat protein
VIPADAMGKQQKKKQTKKEGGGEAPAPKEAPKPAPELKAEANELIKKGDHSGALALLTQALIQDGVEDQHLYYSNRSLCALSLKRYDLAVSDAQKCITLKPDWCKGHNRLGAAHFFADRPAKAAAAYKAGLEVEPGNEAAQQGLASAEAALASAAAAAAEKKPAEDLGPVVGIDLGTTYSCVAVIQEGAGRVEVIQNADGSRTTPSWVAFSSHDGTRLVGQSAKNQAAANPTNTVNDAKRIIGRPFHDAGVQSDLKHFSYKVTANYS